jgi:hypothetical protein
MNPRREHSVIEKEAIEALQLAIDKSFQRLLETAKTQWKRSFAGKDPSDACVRVRIDPEKEQRGMQDSGFTSVQKSSATAQNRRLRLVRFPHSLLTN